MVRLGLKPGAAGWKVHTNPLSYGGTPQNYLQLKECVNKEGYYECGCFEGFELDAKKICVPVPTPEPINNCPDNCSHSCHQGQCTCPEDMVLTGSTRRERSLGASAGQSSSTATVNSFGPRSTDLKSVCRRLNLTQQNRLCQCPFNHCTDKRRFVLLFICICQAVLTLLISAAV